MTEEKVKAKKIWLITLTLHVPYPKDFIFRVEASNPFLAINRSRKDVKKQLGRKRVGNIGKATWSKIV